MVVKSYDFPVKARSPLSFGICHVYAVRADVFGISGWQKTSGGGQKAP